MAAQPYGTRLGFVCGGVLAAKYAAHGVFPGFQRYIIEPLVSFCSLNAATCNMPLREAAMA
jgi:hypothetical protein